MPRISRLVYPTKLLSLALVLAVALSAVVGVVRPRSAYAVAVPVTATGFAGLAGTGVAPSTVLATINNDSTITPGATALAAGNAIIIQFPAGTTLTGANIVAADFTIQQAVWTGGGGPAAGVATVPTGVVVGATTLTFTVAGGSLTTVGGAGQGLVTIAMSGAAGGNEITRPAAGTYAVGVSTPLDFGTTAAVITGGVTSTSIFPISGVTTGGTAFTITGTGFVLGITTVTFGGIAAVITGVGFGGTTITGITPAFATPSVVTVVVTVTPGGTAANLTFTYFTAITVPSAPQLVTAIAGDGQATVTWIAPANNGGGAIIDYTVTASPGGQTLIVGGLSTTFTGLTNGTAYTFSVTARNSAGSGPAFTSSSVTPTGVPGAPSGVSATAGNGQATVTWAAPVTNGGAIIDYTVTASPGGQTVTVGGLSATVTGLTNGTAYTFTVRARNSAGTGSASAASNSVTPKAPGPVATPNGGFWTPGLNGAVMEGTSSPGAAASTISLSSQRTVLALWLLSSGLWQFYLPLDPGISTLTFLPTPASLIAVLG